MDYFVPQIKHETKIAGITFPQFIAVGLGALLCFALYILIPEQILIIAPIIMTLTAFMAFINIHGMPLPTFLAQFISYQLFDNQYRWQRKKIFIKRFSKMPEFAPPSRPLRTGPSLIPQKSKLNKLKQGF